MQNYTPVLLGADLNAYSMAAAFHRAAGKRSHLFARDRLGLSGHSRYTVLHVVPRMDEAHTALAALTVFADSRPEEDFFLVPCGDWYVRVLEEIRESLGGRFSFLIPKKEVFRLVSDKAAFYRLLEERGVSHPDYLLLDEKSGAKEAMEMRPPYVLKAADSVSYFAHPFEGMRKVWYPGDTASVSEILRRTYGAGYTGKMILQRRIGGEHQHLRVLNTFSGSDGRVSRAVLGDVLLEECAPRAVGNHAAIVTRPLDAISFELIRLLDSLGYTGIANFDIILDGDQPYVLECNPRQGRSSDVTRAAGVNLAALLLADAGGLTFPPDFTAKRIYWRSVPDGVVRRYAADRELLSEAMALKAQGLAFSPFDDPEELSGNPTRRAYVFLHQRRQEGVFRRYGKRVEA